MFCRLYKLAIEKELDNFGSVQSPSLTRHLQKCPACHTFYQQTRQLEDQLRLTPAGEFPDERLEKVRANIRQRLSKATMLHSSATGVQSHFPYRIRYAVSTAAVVLFALAGLCYYIVSVQRVDPMTQFIRNTTEFHSRISSLARLPEQTIQTEMQKLTNDAQSAMAFIVNCIPANPAEQYRLDTQKNAGLQ